MITSVILLKAINFVCDEKLDDHILKEDEAEPLPAY
jgi:hypothetical protein